MMYRVTKTILVTWFDPNRKTDEVTDSLLDPEKGHLLGLEDGIVYFTYDNKRYETINTPGAFAQWVESGALEAV